MLVNEKQLSTDKIKTKSTLGVPYTKHVWADTMKHCEPYPDNIAKQITFTVTLCALTISSLEIFTLHY